jgi:predicted DNA-binding protein (MmcQ/YjbR family)
MDIEALRDYCNRLPGSEETTPFGPDTLVYKVGGKIFALMGLEEDECSVNLKCDPERALELREDFPDDVIPGYHMNKKHWNTVYCERNLHDRLIRDLIDHSYELVVSRLPGKVKSGLS